MERGITFKDLLDSALELFQPHPGVETEEKALKMLRKGFEQALSDVNVAALVVAGLRLEEDGRCGLIPGLTDKDFRKDPLFLLADEMIGMAIAKYIAGTRGLFEFVRFDKIKPGILKRLGPILDDVVCGIIAGVSSNVYTMALVKK
jgi:alpha-ribazole phosphatase CobZ